MPERIQRKRTKGWQMPPDTIYVGRPTVWGNPFQLRCAATREMKQRVVNQYRGAICGGPLGDRVVLENWLKDHRWHGGFGSDIVRSFLRGKNLACWCALDQPAPKPPSPPSPRRARRWRT